MAATIVVDVPQSTLFDVTVPGNLGTFDIWPAGVRARRRAHVRDGAQGLPEGALGLVGGDKVRGIAGNATMIGMLTAIAVGMLIAATAVGPQRPTA